MAKTVLVILTFCGIVDLNSANGTTETCINCPTNEQPTLCVNPCLPTCIQPYNVTCNFLVCNKGCECIKGFIRSAPGGPCVAKSDCGKYCGKNQKYDNCGSACPDACNFKNICKEQCVQGCDCKEGYILEELLGECIPKNTCPRVA